jgi:hypothetical protein
VLNHSSRHHTKRCCDLSDLHDDKPAKMTATASPTDDAAVKRWTRFGNLLSCPLDHAAAALDFATMYLLMIFWTFDGIFTLSVATNSARISASVF